MRVKTCEVLRFLLLSSFLQIKFDTFRFYLLAGKKGNSTSSKKQTSATGHIRNSSVSWHQHQWDIPQGISPIRAEGAKVGEHVIFTLEEKYPLENESAQIPLIFSHFFFFKLREMPSPPVLSLLRD